LKISKWANNPNFKNDKNENTRSYASSLSKNMGHCSFFITCTSFVTITEACERSTYTHHHPLTFIILFFPTSYLLSIINFPLSHLSYLSNHLSTILFTLSTIHLSSYPSHIQFTLFLSHPIFPFSDFDFPFSQFQSLKLQSVIITYHHFNIIPYIISLISYRIFTITITNFFFICSY